MTSVVLGDRIKVDTATTGTGTVTLGSASSNAFCTFAEGGISDGNTVAYCIEDSTDFEIGTGVYTASGTTMTRAAVLLSKISGTAGTTKLNLSGTATVRVVAVAEHIYYDGRGAGSTWSPTTSDGAALGTGTKMWSDLFLASGAVVNFNNGDVTFTHSASTLTLSGSSGATLSTSSAALETFPDGWGNTAKFSATHYPAFWLKNTASDRGAVFAYDGVSDVFYIGKEASGTITTNRYVKLDYANSYFGPHQDDQYALGKSTVAWSDLFLASGAVVNFNAGNFTITHSAGLLTMNGALSLGTSNAFTCGTIELGAASDTTLARESAGSVTIEGNRVYSALSNQFGALTEKTTPVSADLILIEDSAASSAKKKVQLGNIAPYLFTNLATDATGTNGNSAQPWFPTNGGVTVAANTTYRFCGLLHLVRSAGTTSHTTSISFGGTATVASLRAWAIAKTGDTTASASASSAILVDTSSIVVKGASTSSTENCMIMVEGTFRIGTAGGGTVIPQFTYSAAPGGAPTIKANSFFELSPIGTDLVASAGTWS